MLSAVHELLRPPRDALLRWAGRRNQERIASLREALGAERFEALRQKDRTRPVTDLVNEVYRPLCPPDLHIAWRARTADAKVTVGSCLPNQEGAST